MQGIMGLQEGQPQDMGGQIDPSKFSPVIESYAKNSPREFGRDILGGMAETDPAMADQFIRELAAMKLPAEVIDALQLMVDNILANPETYAVDRAEFIQEGVPEELLPEQFDPAYFAAFNLALDQLDINKEPAAPAVPAYADGGAINARTISQELSKMGRGGDTMLAHITPEEMRLLRSRGGSGTINPDTGLPEFGLFKKIKKAVGKVVKTAAKVVKSVGKVVKKIAQSPIGKIILTAAAVYFMGPAGFNLAGGMGLTGATAMGVNTFAGSTLVNLASGQKLGQALKGGAIAGAMAGVVSYAMTPSAPPTTGPAPIVEGSFTPVEGLPTSGTVGPSAVTAASPVPSYTPDIYDITQPGGPVQVNTPSSVGPSAVTATAPTTTAAGGISNVSAPVVDGTFTPNPAYTPPAPTSGGIMNTASNAWDATKNMASKAWDTISPSAITERGAVSAQQAGVDAVNNLMTRLPTATPAMQSAAYETAFKAATPGLLSTYGPIAAAGLGAAYLGGAFKPEPVTPPSNIDQFTTTGKDLLERNPSTYGLTYGGGTTTYAANPYATVYTPGTVSTSSYTGNPYDNIYSTTPAPYQTARLAEGGEVQNSASGTMRHFMKKYQDTLRKAISAGSGSRTDVPLQQRSLANLTGELNMIKNAGQGAGVAVPGGDVAAYTKQLEDAIAANNANTSPASYVASAPVTPLRTVMPVNMNLAGRAAMARYAGDPYARLYSNSSAPYPTVELAAGGIASLEDFPRKNGPIDGPGTGTSDSVPAMLSDGEFVFTAKAVRAMGKGSRRKGAKRMYALMKQLEAKGK